MNSKRPESMNKILIILICLFSTFHIKSQDSIRYLDTLVYRDLSKIGVNIITYSLQTVEYQTEGNNSIYITADTNIRYIQFRDGSTVQVSFNGGIYPSEYKSFVPREKIDNKRTKHLLINLNLLSLIRMSPYVNRTFSLGAQYFINSNFSIHGQYYSGMNGIISSGTLPYSITDQYPVYLNSGYEFGGGYLMSTTKKLDLGIRVGVISCVLNQEKNEHYDYEIYSETYNNNYSTTFDGKTYYFVEIQEYSNKTNLDFRSPDYYLALEGNLKLNNNFSLFGNLGIKSSRNIAKYSGGDHYYHFIRLLDSNGNVVEDIQDYYYDYRYYESERLIHFMIRFGLNYHINTAK